MLAAATLIVPNPARSQAIQRHAMGGKHLLSDMGPSIFRGSTPSTHGRVPVPSMEVKFYELGNHHEQINLFRVWCRVTDRVRGTGTAKRSSMHKPMNECAANTRFAALHRCRATGS